MNTMYEIQATTNERNNPNRVTFGTSEMPSITTEDIKRAKRQNNNIAKRITKAFDKVAGAFEVGEGIPSVEPVSKASILGTKVAAALKVAASYHI